MASGAGGMGGGGGGKIRTRRCQHGPVKPYQQGRPQHQGILSRVTESVKNIVPGWLQRYFNKAEDACSCSANTSGVPHWPENTENDHMIYANEENSNISDGRLTPEPTVSNTEEPSTTGTASNYPDVLTRPSLHRSHLNFSVLESPALHCQPSTSSAFPIGSSGFSLVKEIKDSTSQHEDDNISTTSGFSSRASDKDIAVSKNTSLPPLWSPEAQSSHSHSLSQHTATNSKKPAFNLSAFGTLSPSFGNSSVLKTSQLGDSPFYPGKTMYGGAAAAVRQSKQQHTPYQAPVRRQMKAKQLNSQSYGVTSSTARRILQSLEKMSSPLADAKRIPSVSSFNSPLDRSGLIISDHQAKSQKVDSQYPPVQRLMTPKPISIATNRNMYFKPSLTMSGELRKSNQRIDKRHSVKIEKNIFRQNEERESGFSYPNFGVPAANGLSPAVRGGGGKMRRERTHFAASKPPEEEEEMELPVLPKISLPITSSSLPVFNFSPPVSTASSLSPISSQSLTNKVQMTSSSNTGSPIFRFSSPIIKSTEADILPPSSIGFTFSVPIAKTELTGSSNASESIISSSAQDTTAANSSTSCTKRQGEDYEGPFRPAKTMKEGSVLDLLKNPDFASPKVDCLAAPPTTTSPVVYTRPAISSFSSSSSGFGESLKVASSWQCDTCLIQNKATDNKCVACQAAKSPPRDSVKQTEIGTPSKSSKATLPASGTGFGDKFKPAVGTWDCDTCLVQNKPEAIKCVACETPKPGTGVRRTLTLTAAPESAVTVTASSASCTATSGSLGFGDKFKRPVGSWECPICCVTNNAEDNKCVSCMSEKPGIVPASSSSSVPASVASGSSLGLDKFKKPEGSWDCAVCLVQNKADATKCAACEAAKPGTQSEFTGFGTSSASSNSADSPFKFGIPSSSSSSSGSSQTLTNTGNFKFGDQGGFKIGVSSESLSGNPLSEGFKFSKPVGDFKFGVSSDPKPEEVKKDSKNENKFTFGLSSGFSNPASSAPLQFGISNLGQQEKKEEASKSSAGFSFATGVVNSTPTANSLVTSENKSSFSFGSTETKSVSIAPFTCKTPEAKKEEMSAPKGGFGFGSVEPASLPTVTRYTLGMTDEKQQEPVTSTSLVLGKKTDKEEPKCPPVFSFGNSEQTKDESSKATFSFNMVKSSEKEAEQPGKTTFAFGTQANATTDQSTAKPVFSFLNNSSSSSIPTTTTGSGSIFGNLTFSSSQPMSAFVFGQSSNPVSSPAFGNSAEPSTSRSLLFSQDNKPAVTSSTSTASTSLVFGSGTSSNSAAATSGFAFGATTTSSSAGSSFVFGTAASAPSASPAFGATQTPTFGQNPGATQPAPQGFGSVSSSTALFSAASQPPAFGTVSSSSQLPVFGQQPTQSAFGSGAAPNSGSVFQFGSSTTNFNFTNNNPTGVFTFGASLSTPAASTQPSGSGSFPFNPTPAMFTVGSNGKNMFSSAGTGRKIKTAVRRKK
ncbi:nuclear pore complex protein Nup153 isoform X3 [Ochotona curzoniae]|uniref:nuclear pore complex protein Nup153 isoform X3 n=1 Tax=Ochotona curzoniae TaxID=130825 RepID=UPI001B346EC9|nr:nuclear pore complex protein Nup153 isoform X3 [Ochotona curzoniae]